MRPFLLLFLLVCVAACGGDGGVTTRASPQPLDSTGTPREGSGQLAILGGTLIDGHGGDPIEDAYVLISDGLIVEAGCCASSLRVPAGYEAIDATGATIMPGLGDGHVHITRTIVGDGTQFNPDGLRPFLEAGITLMRDVGTASIVFPAVALFADTQTRASVAPRVVWAGPILTPEGGYPIPTQYAPGGQEAASTEDAIEWVHRLADGGARIIKVALERGYFSDEGWPLMELEMLRAITGAAHERGLLVTAHVTSLEEVRLAINGGVDNLAHSPLELLPDEVVSEIVEQGIGVVSTATIWDTESSQIAGENVRRVADAGGLVAVGTDFGCCGQPAGSHALIREMGFLVASGMTHMEVLRAATRGVAEVSGEGERLGTIEAGKMADILIVDGDPLAEIGALARISTVIMEGRIVARPEGEPAQPAATPIPHLAETAIYRMEPVNCEEVSPLEVALSSSDGEDWVLTIGQPIAFHLSVINCSGEASTLAFTGPDRFDFLVFTAVTVDGDLRHSDAVWRLRGVDAEGSEMVLEIPSGQQLVFEGEWDQRSMAGIGVEPGSYFIRASVMACREGELFPCVWAASSFFEINSGARSTPP